MNRAERVAPEHLLTLLKNLIRMLDHHRDASELAKEAEHDSLGSVVDQSLDAHETESPYSRLQWGTVMVKQVAHIETGSHLLLEGNVHFRLGLESSHRT